MKQKILQSGPISPALDGRLAETWDVVRLWADPTPAEALAEIRVVVTSPGAGCDAALMDRLPKLGAIVNFGVGYDKVDVAAARARGVVVSNTPGVLDECVADLGMALILDVLRGTVAGDRFVRAGTWTKGPFPLATRVWGKRLGIVGLGRIGSALARRAEAFRMSIAYHNRSPVEGSPYPRHASVADLAAWADVLVLTLPGGAATRHIVSSDELEALGPNGFLVNIARGSVVDTAALIAALRHGRIGGAALDVFENEPHVPDELKSFDNVVLLPHLGSATRETRRAMEDLTFDNAATWFAEGRLITPV